MDTYKKDMELNKTAVKEIEKNKEIKQTKTESEKQRVENKAKIQTAPKRNVDRDFSRGY